jgi:hypothetical protein
MGRAALIARVATLVGVCAGGAPVPIAIASATTYPHATVSGPTVHTPASERATVRAGGAAAVAATSTAQGFLGIATELNTIPALSGSAVDPDTPFVHLLRNLSPGAPFLLRLGGNSGDFSWWAIPGMKKPPYLYTLTPRWGANVHALLTALGGKAILGVNLKEGSKTDSKIASAEVADFNRYVGASLIDAFELGNEPKFYPSSVAQRRVPGHYTIADYGRKFSTVASALGGAPLAGPGSGSPRWLPKLGAMLNDMRSRLKLVTVHAYPMKNCSRITHLSVSDFFARASIQGLADSVRGMVRAAAADGKPLRVDEINGVTCGGKAGFSNSFGEAPWALNVLPALWQAGVKGVNFQTIDGNFNQMIAAKHSASGWSVSVEPEYYGLLTFAGAAPAGSHLLRISNPGLAHFYQFAVRAPDESERVVLTNVGSIARTIGVTASGTRDTGSLSLLSAGSLSATGGTTLAGQSLSSRTGQLTGTPSLTLVRPNAKGVYAVRVPAHAAAILLLSAPAPASQHPTVHLAFIPRVHRADSSGGYALACRPSPHSIFPRERISCCGVSERRRPPPARSQSCCPRRRPAPGVRSPCPPARPSSWSDSPRSG